MIFFPKIEQFLSQSKGNPEIMKFWGLNLL